jgi:acyl-CoA synthetase (AMP-forming)/AMP-acid ligase II
MHPPGLEFLRAFFGAIYAGCVAVPVYPPDPGRVDTGLGHVGRVAEDCGAEIVLTTRKLMALREAAADIAPSLAKLAWVATDEIDEGCAEMWRTPDIGADSLAFLQYTSGSTGMPKGVMLRHGNLLANQDSIREAMAIPQGAVFVSWLPLYHDMGLIGCALQPLYVGGCCRLMSPFHFIQSPSRWLKAITRYRGYCSGGPNFAYDLCVDRISGSTLASLDLSSWKVAFNGAEPIKTATLRRFIEKFASCGLGAGAVYPCYGLAEATLIVTGAAPGGGFISSAFERSALERGVGEPAQAGGIEFASSGTAPSNQEIAIAAQDCDTALADGEVGEICVRGPSIAQGYWGKPALSREIFNGVIAGKRDWLRTGDLGFIRDRMLYVVGRKKDLIIVRGRKFFPQDIEEAVQSLDPRLRAACGAAFGVEVDGEEKLVVVQEIKRLGRDDPAVIIRAITRVLSEQFHLFAHEIVLAEPKGVPKTLNGKLRRSTCKQAYLEDALGVVATSLRRQEHEGVD